MYALSFSRWKDSLCPFRFHALYIAKSHKEPDTDAMKIGREVAEILCAYRAHCYRMAVTSDLGFFDQVKPNKEIAEQVFDLLGQFQRSLFISVPLGAGWVHTEGKFTFDSSLNLIAGDDAWFSKSAAFRIIFDFAYVLDDTLHIIDDKTGHGDPDKLQLELYAFLGKVAITHQKPALSEKVRNVVCQFNELGKRQVDEFLFTFPDDFQDTRQKILDRLAEVNSWTEFPAVACSQCKWCSVPGCSIRESAQNSLVGAVADVAPAITLPTEITSKEEAEKAVQFVLFAEPVIDGVKELLRAYVDEHGPVYAGGKVAEVRPNEPWKCTDMEKLTGTAVWLMKRKFLGDGMTEDQATMKAKGAVLDMLSASESAVEKTLKKFRLNGSVDMLLKSTGERKKYKPRFGLYNDSI